MVYHREGVCKLYFISNNYLYNSITNSCYGNSKIPITNIRFTDSKYSCLFKTCLLSFADLSKDTTSCELK